jgi:hypothetical protein
MSQRDTIYVALLDEGIGVWRPVEAQRLSPDTWLIVDQDYDPTPRDGSLSPVPRSGPARKSATGARSWSRQDPPAGARHG